jgi:hypothetical protein
MTDYPVILAPCQVQVKLSSDPSDPRRRHLWVPRTLSTSCDQAVFVDHATDTSVSPDSVLLKVDRFGERFQRGSGVQRPVRPVPVVMGLVLAQDPPQMVLMAVRVIMRKTNRRHMTGDHHGRTARRATLLVTAADEILGTHTC